MTVAGIAVRDDDADNAARLEMTVPADADIRDDFPRDDILRLAKSE